MGYGFPAAIGAKLGCPEKEVFDIAGDGSFQMNIQELATAVVNEVPVKVIILNNGVLGMVRQWQDLFYEKRFSSTTLHRVPDFVKVAEAYGALGLRATKPSELEGVLKEAIDSEVVTVVDVIISPDEKVSPMVPAGASLSEILELEAAGPSYEAQRSYAGSSGSEILEMEG
jgi:acetolactate synthase-1/2/3 large subunit